MLNLYICKCDSKIVASHTDRISDAAHSTVQFLKQARKQLIRSLGVGVEGGDVA